MNSNNNQELKPDHISVCICTFKRPIMLKRLLDCLIKQSTDGAFTFEIVIVDNDKMRSAEDLVHKCQERVQLKIIYDCEPEQSISLARNRTIRNATGNFIATIDDDEFPAENWLYKAYQCLKDNNADGVLGPVLPHFPDGAPVWLQKSKLCDRPRNFTGSPITHKDLRTGNVLFQRYVFEKDDKWFDPAKGLTGGSDGEFLWRQIKRGRKFIWCDEALVFETVPEVRWPASFYLKRQFRIGTMTGKIIRRSRKIHTILKTCFLALVYAALLPFAMLAGKHIWIKVMTKLYYNAGCVLSFFSLVRVQQRQ
ncbi:MAG: glycosyltransferase family 2 protein [Desulfobacterium sp.]|nr:glycosyltransferase family 2 protein [Desulfobacterium sp.]MBU3946911.1 glycosyltransferase [Pseudomonadota bacterium]MBU4037680.1 glycosyltransferase [Pseudomonadota bacterium]